MMLHITPLTMKMTKTVSYPPANLRILIFILILIVIVNNGVNGTKKRVHIPDDLHDVEDNEEDDAWKEWGQKKKMTKEEFDPPPENFSNLDLAQMQAEIMKRQVGASYGFVKLQLTDQRTPDMVSDIAEKWTNLARTGAVEVTFMGFDLTTVMFSLQNAQNTNEIKEFVLSQPESYEIKMGEQFFRRPGDPPYDDLLKQLHKSKKKRAASLHDTIMKTEL